MSPPLARGGMFETATFRIAATRQEAAMSLYAAIDLHSTNSVLAVLDEHDQPVRQRRLPNELPAILKELEPFRDEVTGIVVESTYNGYWLVDGLKAHGYHVHLANTAAVPQYAGLKYSGDESDARHLAHLLRLGILPEGYIYPREDRSVRDLLRRRFQLVRMAVGLMLSVQSTWARHTGQRLSANAVRQLSGVAIEQAFPDPSVRFSILTHLQVWRAVEEQVRQVERWIVASRTRCKEQLALRTVPGIGLILGLTIALETGDIARASVVIAIKAVAHKLARAGYYLLRDGGTFDVQRAFG
jgi:transposase